MKQLALQLPRWGGKRKGAGRKRQAPRPRVSHGARPSFDKPAPVQVTLRLAAGVWNLRSNRCSSVLQGCFADARGRFGVRIIEFAVMGNHLHLIAEADSSNALSRAMQGFCVRIARRLNKLMERRGRVFDDHYHSRVLRSPTELVKSINYVLGNHEHHYGPSERIDPYSSLACDRRRLLSEPVTWLIRAGWQRARGPRSIWVDRWLAVREPGLARAA